MKVLRNLLILTAALTSFKATAQDDLKCSEKETGGYEFGPQSPVELISNECSICQEKTALEFRNYNRSYQLPAVVTNNGYTVNIELPELGHASILGGPLKHEPYNAVAMHLHWGESGGSEHVIDNKRFSVELHIVHISSNCSTVEEAVSVRKVAVVGILIQEDPSLTTEHEGLAQITDALIHVQAYNSSTEVSNLTLSKLISNDSCRRHFNYRGSLTTPPYSEVVNWIVCVQTLQIPSSQYLKFLTLRNSFGELIVRNYREIQPKGFRQICRTYVNESC